MPPSITSVNVTPSVLTPGESQVYVEAIVSDVVGVTNVYAQAYDPFMGSWTSEVIVLTLASGDSLNGTYAENIVFAPDVNDGQYVVAVFASNAESVECASKRFTLIKIGIFSLFIMIPIVNELIVICSSGL